MERKIYKVTYRINGRNMSRKFDCFMDAEEFFVSRCRDYRCENVDVKCFVGTVEKTIPSYMWSF